MRLATLRNGAPDGGLIVVSADGQRFLAAPGMNLLAAMADWARAQPLLQRLALMLEKGGGATLDPARLAAPLPPHLPENSPMLPVERIIGESGIAQGPDGLRLDMRLPWYRSLPLSTTQVEAVAVDGQPVELAGATITLAGKSFTLAQAADAVDDFWFVLDIAWLTLPALSLEPGRAYAVSLTLTIPPPYIPGMKRVNNQTEQLIVGEAA